MDLQFLRTLTGAHRSSPTSGKRNKNKIDAASPLIQVTVIIINLDDQLTKVGGERNLADDHWLYYIHFIMMF
jgi:hypothetical protein